MKEPNLNKIHNFISIKVLDLKLKYCYNVYKELNKGIKTMNVYVFKFVNDDCKVFVLAKSFYEANNFMKKTKQEYVHEYTTIRIQEAA